MNFLYRIGYLRLTGFSEHSFFYFAWSLSDLVCNESGLGFNGYDSNGKPKWDLLTNFKIFDIDVTNRTTEFVHYFYFAAFWFKFPSNVKMYIDSWNIQTAAWLRFVCYDRMPKFKTLSVFILTIIWHGFEARFFFSFGTLGILVFAGRSVSCLTMCGSQAQF